MADRSSYLPNRAGDNAFELAKLREDLERLTTRYETLKNAANWVVQSGSYHADDCGLVPYNALEALEEALTDSEGQSSDV